MCDHARHMRVVGACAGEGPRECHDLEMCVEGSLVVHGMSERSQQLFTCL
jgi:hypothetical protein